MFTNRENKSKDSKGGSFSAMGGAFFQPKLAINEPGDVYEHEADVMADHVMRMSSPEQASPSFFKPAITGVQRKCQHCEEEDKLVHRKENSGAQPDGGNQLDSYVSSLSSSGTALPESSRMFFEPHFGHDFSGVRVHTDQAAVQSAESINALAYTTGNNIVFNSRQFSPESDSGKRLIAHELTHVVQQGQTNSILQKTPSPHSHCPANQNNAPADPMTALGAANDRAVTMALGTSGLLFSESLFMQDSTFGPSNTSGFYHRRFGDPPAAPHGRFRNRFNGTLHNTLLLAKASELQFLSDRFARIGHFLERNINFKCAGTGTFHLGDCTPSQCGPLDILASCPTVNHGYDIAVCSGFWGKGAPDEQAVGIIHEASHMLYHYGDHDTAPFAQSSAQRLSEPECYASLAADIYGVTPFDPSCPII